jgi:hypothetical protein
MNTNVGGRLFAGSLLVAGLGAFSFPTPYRWAPIAWLALVGALFAVANWACIAIFARRGRAPSMFPLLGNSVLVLAGLAVPIESFHRWAPVGLLADPWLVATLIGLATLTLRGPRNRRSDPMDDSNGD